MEGCAGHAMSLMLSRLLTTAWIDRAGAEDLPSWILGDELLPV
ncbi:MAG: hypothetical protein ACI9K8_001390 [Reinekea sp.]|jgi:hypothetical protein